MKPELAAAAYLRALRRVVSLGFVQFFLCLAIGISWVAGDPMPEVSVIPKPSRLEMGQGRFVLGRNTVLTVVPGTEATGQQLASLLRRSTGLPLPLRRSPAAGEAGMADSIQVALSGDAAVLGEEGYQLEVLPDRVLIRAASGAGAFYGCMTLRQLFPPALESLVLQPGVEWSVPVVRIEDKPRFPWRGVLLDPARQFISKQGILRCLDWMAYHKLNRLHLHLTDVDGWRVEIRKYPKLTRVGAWADLGEGVRIGGFYTRQDIREIVAHAAQRFITVIPEIETPSHSGAALVAYPELNCFGTRRSIAPFPIDPLCGSEFCPGNERVFEFLDGVFAEVAELFPSPILHVGGDEAEMRYWGECPKCQAKQKQVGNLHAWFMQRVTDLAAKRGKRIMGWGGVTKGAIYTCWDNEGSSGWAAAKSGWDVVMSTGNHHYFNYNIERTTLKTAYDFDPLPPSAGLTPEARSHVLGVEACLWGEMIPEDHIESQAFPRVLALAERGWGVEKPDFEEFLGRVKTHVNRLAAMGIVTGPGFGHPIQPALPARAQDAMPPLIYPSCFNRNDEDWRWTLTGIDRGQGYDALYPLHAFDGDLDTYHMTWGPRRDVDSFTIVLSSPASFDRIQAITGMPNGDHRLRQGVLEVSTGYGRWQEVARFKNGVADASLDNRRVVALRIRSTINQPPNAVLAIREFVLWKNGKSTLRELSPVERLRIPAAIPAAGR